MTEIEMFERIGKLVERNEQMVKALREAEDFISAQFENLTAEDAGDANDVLRTIRAALKPAA